MKAKIMASLPLRLPVIRGVVSFFGYCPYFAEKCEVNWILAPMDCGECRKSQNEKRMSK